jgi:nicotinamide mononucleotide transporter
MISLIKRNIGILMLFIGILMQIITFALTNDSLLSLISGISGVLSVVYCSQRKLSFYTWSFIQLITYAIICYNANLYGKLLENAFYFITLIGGLFIWKTNSTDGFVNTKQLTEKQFVLIIALMLFLIIEGTFILQNFKSNQPLLDSTTTVIGIMAQILMILRFKENWILWFIQDIICIILWTNVNNYCMVSQYIFWTINTMYGYYIWNKNIS